MTQERLDFAEDFGIVFERSGSIRMLGRVLGILYVSDPNDVTAEQLAGWLHASRGSISQATRRLVEIGLVQRVNKPGIRADFFRIQPNAWVESSRHQLHELRAMQQLFQRGVGLMADTAPESRLALETAREFMEFLDGELIAMYARWDALQEQRS